MNENATSRSKKVIKMNTVLLSEIKDEFGYVDSGLFAVALTRITPMPIQIIRTQGFAIHVCCKLGEKFIDAYGVNSKDQILRRVGYEFPILTFEFATEDQIQKLGKFSEQTIQKTVPYAKVMLDFVQLDKKSSHTNIEQIKPKVVSHDQHALPQIMVLA